jgi:hypothetical protein
VIKDVEKQLSEANLLLSWHFFPAVALQLLQKEQSPLNEEEILPSLEANAISTHFLLQ